VRNITDVDDKINARAAERGEHRSPPSPADHGDYHADMAALGTLPPDIEPRATAHIPEIIDDHRALIAGGHAYEAEGHVLFAVASDPDYGNSPAARRRT
jgi:cysteinyl-tRNA synthetase